MTRTLWILCMAAASLAAKDRAWQTGQLLDKNYNSYFKVSQTSNSGGPSAASFVSGDNGMLATNTRASEGEVSFEDYILQSTDVVYLVEFAHFKTFQLPNLSVLQPVKFAIDKNRIYIMDLDRHEFETSILKQVPRRGPVLASSAPPAPSVAKVDPPKTDPAKVDQSKADNAKNAPKSGDLFARGAPAADDSNPPKPKPAPAAPIQTVAAVKQDVKQDVKKDVNKQDVKPTPAVQTQQAPAKPDPKLQASVTKPAKVDTPPPPKPAPVSKPEPKVEAAVTKPVQRQEPTKPEGPVVKASTKDRAWQSGNLLSVANNNYFFNITYTSDIEGSSWPFSQGSDGRMTVTGQIATVTTSPYTYDNYVIESEYVAYLVQRMRPKTSPAVRLPGTKTLKFAVDKGKMWVIDEQGVEYETKVIKLIQKDAIVDPLTRSAAR